MPESAAYAAVPYLGGVYPQSHPDVLATVGGILGMAVAPMEQARVLEVGCADGANLLGMAATAPPGARFVGVDGEPGQIARGEALRREAGLDSVRLLAADLRDLTADALGGTFDYIVVHGVFSWVAPDARRALLDLCRAVLRPQGIAYISYNVLPAWHMAAGVRDLMRYHTRHLADPDEIIEAALGILRFAAAAADRPADRRRYGEYARYLPTLDRDCLFHDHLAGTNQPLYLHELAAMARASGLQYLGDAEPHRSLPLSLPEETQAALARLAGEDPVALEQYLDALVGRELRRSLLCHAEVDLCREADARSIAMLKVRSALQPVRAASPGGQGVVWQAPGDASAAVVAQTAGQQAILERLRAAWPRAVPLDEADEEGRELVWACFLRGLLTVHRWSPDLLTPQAAADCAQPRVSALVRAQARAGLPLTSALQREVALADPAQRALVARLDGGYRPTARERAAIRQLAALGFILAP